LTYGVTASLSLLVLAFVITAALTLALTRVARRKGVLDVPNHRTSHERPIPRGGGLSVVVVFLCYAAFLFVVDKPAGLRAAILWLLIGGFAVAAIGFLDDLKDVSQTLRLTVHMVAVAFGFIVLPSLPSLNLVGYVAEPGWIVMLLLLVGHAWFINLFNFMDGIDGIAGVQALTMLGCAAVIMHQTFEGTWLMMFGVLMSSVGGFLIWNWPPAKVFMGDACSGFLGFVLGALAIITSVYGPLNLWVWLILGGVFLVDSTTTLVVRMGRGERWHQPHRSHAYQKLSRRVGSHEKVTVAVFLINVLWLGPLAFLAAKHPNAGLVITAAAWTPILATVIWAGAGKQEQSLAE
jgi:Fuc2NAc and GlcNAc transferase